MLRNRARLLCGPLAALALASHPAVADPMPNRASLGIGYRHKIVLDHFISLSLSYGRIFGGRARIDSVVHIGANYPTAAADIQSHIIEGSIQASGVARLTSRLDAALGVRAGIARFYVRQSRRDLRMYALAAALVPELTCRVHPHLEVRVAPLVVTGFRRDLWGLVAGPEVHVAVRF